MCEEEYDCSDGYVEGSHRTREGKEDLTWIIQVLFYHHLVIVEYQEQVGGGDQDLR